MDTQVPKPFGPQGILYGDKVINVANGKRRNVYPEPDGEAYLANGDLGIIVGQYKTKKMRGHAEAAWKRSSRASWATSTSSFPANSEMKARNPLELAYALTVHKTQGSEFGMTILVVPSPCRLLSRELLYTALTRHRDRLIFLHQGPIADYRRFAGEEYSEIAGRMTNLFTDPLPREVTIGSERRFLEDRLIHRTERGELVRSKSEVIIADKLHSRGIDYVYEQPFSLADGRMRYPDFTIADPIKGVTYYWEHQGMLGDTSYRARWARKRTDYLNTGMVPASEENNDADAVLIETSETIGGGLDSREIARIIDEVLIA